MNKVKVYIIFIVTILIVFKTDYNACAQKFTEYEVKMVYLYQFSKFVNWPLTTLNKSDEFVIGVYGSNPFGDLPNKIYKDRLFKGKKCIVKDISTKEEALNCQMIFINDLTRYDVMKFLKELNNPSILIIGNNIDDFCLFGGMINFTPKESEFRFEINPNRAEEANITISSKLFLVAKIVSNSLDKF